MVFVVELVIFAVFFRGLRAIVRHYSVRGGMTDRGFAIAFAAGFSLAVGVTFFSGLVIEDVAIDLALTRLGLGIMLVNAAAAFPVAYFGHKYAFRRLFARLFGPSEEHRR
jgi:hypothetical protein